MSTRSDSAEKILSKNAGPRDSAAWRHCRLPLYRQLRSHFIDGAMGNRLVRNPNRDTLLLR
jgi:hypothetical protein